MPRTWSATRRRGGRWWWIPSRDMAQYVADAEATGLRVDRVIETHFHADFLSGHLELAAATGADICYGEAAASKADFPIDVLPDGDRLALGEVTARRSGPRRATPRSRSASWCGPTRDEAPFGVLTGDALFIGDVGRPGPIDLGGGQPGRAGGRSVRLTARQALEPTRCHPGVAGPRRRLGVRQAAVDRDGVDDRRAAPANYALQPMSEDDFVALVTEGQSGGAEYFVFAAGRSTSRPAAARRGVAPPG